MVSVTTWGAGNWAARSLSRRRVLGGAVAAGTSVALAACGAGGAASPAAKQPELKGTLQLWATSALDFSKDAAAALVKDFETAYPGTKVEVNVTTDDSGDKARVAAAGGTPPDLVSVNGLTPQSVAADGVAASFEPFLKNSKVIRKADLWPTYVQDHSWKGAMVGMAYGPDIRFLYMNADQYGRAGLDVNKPPKTWQEMEQTIAKATVRDGSALKTVGFHPFIGSGNELTWTVPFWQLGGELLSADGTKVTIDNEKGLQAWEWLVKIIDAQGGWGPIQDVRKAASAPAQAFVDGTVATYYEANSTRSGDVFKKAIAQGFTFGFASYPMPPSGGRRITFGGVHTFIMPKGSKQQELAWTFIEFLLSPEQNIKIADAYDRIPVRQSVAHSAQYIRNDPFRQLAADEMAGRKWLIPAPGAWAMRSDVSTVATDILEKGMSIRAALAKTQQTLQQKLDAALQAAK